MYLIYLDYLTESIISGQVEYFIESMNFLPGHVDYFGRDLSDFVGGYVEFSERLHLADGVWEVRQVIVC